MNYIKILLIAAIFLPIGTQAQEGPKLSIGERGTQYTVTNQAISASMSTGDFRSDPKLYVHGGKNDYMIAHYDISVLVNNKDIIGPFTIGDTNAQDILDKLYNHFAMGAKVFYDKIVLACRDCVPPKTTAAPGLTVVLE